MGYNYMIEKKTLWEKEKLLIMSNFFFSHGVFKSCLLLIRENEYLWSNGLNLRIVSERNKKGVGRKKWHEEMI